VKRNPATDCANRQFEYKLKQRRFTQSPDFRKNNIAMVQEMGTGREL
jgi:hypothetical protein